MKKGTSLFLVLLLILNLFVIGIIAQSDINENTGLSENAEKLAEAGRKFSELSDEEQRREYLKQEWGRILRNKKYIGPVIEAYDKISPYTDPVFRYTIGMTPSLSWLFVLTLVLWVTFFILIFRAISLLTESNTTTMIIIALFATIAISLESLDAKVILFALTAVVILVILTSLKLDFLLSVIISAVSSFILTAFVSPVIASTLLKSYEPLKLFGLPRFLAELIIGTISLLGNFWFQLIAIIVVIVILFIFDASTKSIKEFFQKWRDKLKEKREKMMNQLDKQELSQDMKTVHKFAKTLEGD